MVSTYKLFLLGVMVTTSVVLSTTCMTLSLFVERKRRLVRNRKRQTGPTTSITALGASSSSDGPAIGDARGRFKTVRPAIPPATSDLSLHRSGPAPGPLEPLTAADAHYAKAARLMSFDRTGGEAGDAVPAIIRQGAEGRQDRRGADFVKLERERRWGRRSMVYGRRRGGSMGSSPIEVGERKGSIWSGGGDGVVVLPETAATLLRLIGVDVHGEVFRTARDWVAEKMGVEFVPPGEAEANAPSSGGDGSGGEEPSGQTRSQREAREALFHLERAADLGHPDAQYALASALASGILPVDNSIRRSLNGTLMVPQDFSEGGPQLARAIVLWHAAAMEGHVEAAVALGYRHRYSAMGGRHDSSHIISDKDLIGGGGGDRVVGTHGPTTTITSTAGGSTVTITSGGGDATVRGSGAGGRGGANHPAAPASHYGVLGTCESSALYYEAAADAVMDETESSPLRGKVTPALDRHRLAEIHMHGGASSALHGHNKPDELEEALQYYRLRASPDSNPAPDVSAAYTLANFYHYGMRGVKQDMKLALKYYEIAAEGGSWEAAGQAGKFYLWGMGVPEEGRDLLKAYAYFNQGAPGGVDGCTRRLRAKRDQNKNKSKKNKAAKAAEDEDDDAYDEDDDEYDEDDGNLCDHPAVNGMGLLHLLGVPDILNPNPHLAKKYFTLSRDMGNMDASYNLAMMSLGWMEGTLDIHGDLAPGSTLYDESADDDIEDEDDESRRAANKVDFSGDPRDKTGALPGAETERIEIDGGQVIITATRVRPGTSDTIEATEQVNSVKATEKAGDVDPKEGSTVVDDTKDGAKATKKPKPPPPKTGPTKVDYSFAFRELVKASQKGHMQAKHRLGQMLIRGVTIDDPLRPGVKVEAVAKNCLLALNYFRDVVENGSTFSARTRAAYKQYVAGEYESALRNYLAAAEGGSAVGQINAAFLLERGHCLGMGRVECSRASVRLWRAAARQGNEEACLRVGDFYYYGRLQEDADDDADLPIKDDGSEAVDMKEVERRRNAVGYAMGPFPWVRYAIYPEDAAPVLRKKIVRGARWLVAKASGMIHSRSEEPSQDAVGKETEWKECPGGSESVDGTCRATDTPSASPIASSEQHSLSPEGESEGDSRQDHLALAVQYYRRAVEEHESPRANFNLGFMHEWGLGLTQDFPLAKRHYDLAASTGRSGEAELAVSMALVAMDVHEKVMRAKISWEEWREARRLMRAEEEGASGTGERGEENSPSPADPKAGHPVPPTSPVHTSSPFLQTGNAHLDVALKHLLSWETAAVIFLTVVLTLLIQWRLPGHERRRR